MGRKDAWSAAATPLLRQQYLQAESRQMKFWRANAVTYHDPEYAQSAAAAIAADLDEITDCNLWWGARSILEFAYETAASLPDWSPAEAIPDTNGLMLFAQPLIAVPWSGCPEDVMEVNAFGVKHFPVVSLDALRWTYLGAEEGLFLHFYSRIREYRHTLDPRRRAVPFVRVLGMQLNAGIRLKRPIDSIEDFDGYQESLAALVGALWLAISQPRLTETRVLAGTDALPARTTAVRAAAPSAGNSVTIVDVRHPVDNSLDKDGKATTGRPRSWSHRWWVDGHWRQQACGPQLSQRKPVWIHPYVKGASDRPVVDKPRVNVAR